MGELSNLRHLELEETYDLVNFPESIGELVLLRTLSKFIVGAEPNSLKIGGLKLLSHLQGSLEIAGLEYIANVNEVSEVKLKEKKNVRSLTFDFNIKGGILFYRVFNHGGDDEEDGDDNEKMEIILKGLEPPEGLEELKIRYYPGREFPFWISSLSNLVKLEVYKCEACVSLPCLGNLAFLEEVELTGIPAVQRLGREFYGVDTEVSNKDLFPRLKKLSINKMYNLIEWEFPFLDNKKTMPRLSVLEILDCPKLNVLPYQAHDDAFPALSELYIKGCSSQLLIGAGKLKLLKKLELDGINSLQCLDEVLSEISEETKLEKLTFKNMKMWEEWSLPFGIDVFSNLVELEISSCNSLRTLPALGRLKNLESLVLYDFYCPNLSGRQPCLPSRLQELWLESDLGEFSTSLPVNNSYHKLTDVKIDGSECEVLPSGFDKFTAIKRLEISECDHLDFLPEHFRPLNNLQELLINDCSLLSKSCIKGENWSTTARTPSIWIDGKPVTPSYA
ncbi:hypothetical protein ACHQM5_011972 [Ranunculus cassubicifolius]